MISGEVSKFPYNAKQNDDKIYFSDQLCHKLDLVWMKAGKTAFLVDQTTGQLICIVRENLIYRMKSIKSKKVEITCDRMGCSFFFCQSCSSNRN